MFSKYFKRDYIYILLIILLTLFSGWGFYNSHQKQIQSYNFESNQIYAFLNLSQDITTNKKYFSVNNGTLVFVNSNCDNKCKIFTKKLDTQKNITVVPFNSVQNYITANNKSFLNSQLSNFMNIAISRNDVTENTLLKQIEKKEQTQKNPDIKKFNQEIASLESQRKKDISNTLSQLSKAITKHQDLIPLLQKLQSLSSGSLSDNIQLIDTYYRVHTFLDFDTLPVKFPIVVTVLNHTVTRVQSLPSYNASLVK